MGVPDVSYKKLKALIYKGEVYLDEEGFYCYGDGSFYDPDGFFFNENGYDKYGGYYDETGNYVPGESKEDEYYQTYEDQDEEDDLDDDDIENLALMEYLEDDEEDEENQPVDLSSEKQKLKQSKLGETKEQEQDRQAEESEHVLPAVEWVLKQPENKRLAVIIENIPYSAKEKNVEIFIKKHIYQPGEDFGPETVRVNIEKDKRTHKSLARAWVMTANKTIIVRLLNLHYRVSLIPLLMPLVLD